MSIILAIFLGLVQGLTEFLPVSSSGHLILFQHLFKMPGDMLLFNIILHLATLCAVILVFHKKIWQLVRHPFNKTNLYLVVSTAVTCAFVLLFKDFIDRTFTHKILPVTFMLTALVLYAVTIIKPKDKPVTGVTAIAVGLMQGIAVIPGLSRSGMTISTMLATGTKRQTAAEFSFLMSIPIIIASFLYEMLESGGKLHAEILPTAVAFVVALASGIFAIKFMLHIIQRVNFRWFSLYLVGIAIACLILF